MVSYAVDTVNNDDQVQYLRGVTEKLRASLSTLMQKAEAFKAANNGLAPDSYDQAQQLWNQGMREMENALATKQTNLARITENYRVTDAQGASLFQR